MKTIYTIREVKDIMGGIRSFVFRNCVDEKPTLNAAYIHLEEVRRSWEMAYPDKKWELDIVEIDNDKVCV